ncbi:MAG: DUF1156 domain-containing protein [Acidimicrobiales bacterium]|nr:DUF1156 domain-containing protein [Acidimicrobiales bacterium]MYG60348.1 DUF1156 domain-containing protein [Acidimicrobiales bacterium]MYH73227.1 DUF1156 domain-containing protein [Acidimicrobiales bacterium]MYK71525.1 DUF1156 domain-containing protein [Acidimicrobiales bacterium]
MTAGAYRPKLIEVALPLAAINAEAAREKSIRHGHPSTLHLWWARRPLAAARAVIWASLVDDPSAEGYRDHNDNLLPTAEAQEDERERLFGILKRLVRWENSSDAKVLEDARAEIDRAFPDGPPPILDPFAGGGAIPLEAQRLGLTALAGDLNPVAVLINKAMIEIPPRFAGSPPVHPDIDTSLTTWERAQGLAADVEAYGQWMRDEAERRIGHLYPDATGPDGQKLTPIAWIWARTVESPDPSWSGHVPLVASWTLSKKKGKPTIWIEPIIDRATQTISYEIREGGEPAQERTVIRGNGTCIATGAAMPGDYIKSEGRADRMSHQLMAIAAEGERGRVYVPAVHADERDASCGLPDWVPGGAITQNSRYMLPPPYGMDEWWKLFTPRQLTALATFSDLIGEVKCEVRADAVAAGLADGDVRLRDGGAGATAYADAVATYLAFAIDKMADLGSSLVAWEPIAQCPRHLFGRQAVPMVWDFAEANPFSNSSGSFMTCLKGTLKGLTSIGTVLGTTGSAVQRDARARMREAAGATLSTDPPYYDNVPYADISDFFYVWLRKNLSETWPNEFSTLATPKFEELVADDVRAGSKQQAEEHFESGMAEFMHEIAVGARADAPSTVYYAFKATESKEGKLRSTGWDTFLQAVLDAGLRVMSTWPIRTETAGRLRAHGSNALASSIVLACRPRPESAPMATRGEFIAALRTELPEAVRLLQSGNIAPVDMAQSTIGPGIKVFSRYAKVVEADGSAMLVSAALSIINDVLGEVLDGEEAELDRDTRFALTWFAEHQHEHGPSGDAESVAKAKNTSLEGLADSGIGEAHGGKFRLYRRDELKQPWSPAEDDRFTIWEALQYLVAALERSESEAADLLHTLGGNGDRARQLAYLLYQKANDNGWAAEANAYNSLITAWPSLREGALAAAARATAPVEQQML